MMGLLRKKQLVLTIVFGCLLTFLVIYYLKCRKTYFYKALGKTRKVDIDKEEVVTYDRNMPLIFIGGMPRSGTTLMRAMLDAHSEIRCGEETRLVPRLLGMKNQWFKSQLESARLKEAGITEDVVNDAVASFILEIIVKHGEPAPKLCNKDPFAMRYSTYLNQLFPNGKFILMIRDGRAVVHSIISRQITITGFDLKDYRQCLRKWNTAVEVMFNQCVSLGRTKCLMVYYEQLVLHPREWLEKIVKFLDVPFEDSMLHHEEYINKKGGISLSKRERSTDQVIKPVYYDSLTKWVGHIPQEVVEQMPYHAPMLRKLGYDPYAHAPKYDIPHRVQTAKDADDDVVDNSSNVHPYTE